MAWLRRPLRLLAVACALVVAGMLLSETLTAGVGWSVNDLGLKTDIYAPVADLFVAETQAAAESEMVCLMPEAVPAELVEAAIERIERLNPKLNAICTQTFDAAMKQARDAEAAVMRGDELGLLHGIPTTIKDLAFTKGVRTMGGSFIHRDRIPEIDHVHVERLRRAGAIFERQLAENPGNAVDALDLDLDAGLRQVRAGAISGETFDPRVDQPASELYDPLAVTH